MLGLLSILSLFRKEFNKFNYTGAQMLDSIYHMPLKLKTHKNIKILPSDMQRYSKPHYGMLL